MILYKFRYFAPIIQIQTILFVVIFTIPKKDTDPLISILTRKELYNKRDFKACEARETAAYSATLDAPPITVTPKWHKRGYF